MKPAKRVESLDLSGIRKMFDMVGEDSSTWHWVNQTLTPHPISVKQLKKP
jgi:hypothetical protein